jgi:hypothetical protein
MKNLGVVLLVLFSPKFFPQLSGVYNIPSTYSTLAAAIQALNASGTSSAVTIEISAGYTETAPAGGYSLTATGTSLTPITFQKTGTGANPLLTAYSGGSGTPGTAVQDGVWRLIGCDYITIDGISISDPNTANNFTMEYGIGLFKASAVNGCQHNVIRNCIITLNRINNASGTAPSVDGSRGINVVNALATVQNAHLTITNASGSNSYNQFYGNTIQNCNIGVALIGYADASPFTFADTGNDIGGSSQATGNKILNFGGGGTGNPTAAIRTLAQYGINISNNLINNNNGAGVNHATVTRGIYLNTAAGASAVINNNTLTIRYAGTTSQVSVIENLSGAAGINNTVTISNNLITGCTASLVTSGAYNGIYNAASSANLIISGNTFSLNTSNVISGSTYLVRNSGQVSSELSITANVLSHAFTGTSAATGPFYGIYNSGGALSASLNISANQFTGLTHANVTGTGTLSFIYNTADCSRFDLSGNLWNNLTLNHSGSGYFMNNNSSTQNSLAVNNNSITNVSRNASAANIYCYYSASSSPGTCVQLYSGNLISNITATNAGTGSFYGIYSTEGNNSPYPRKTAFNNVLSNINMNGSGTFYGLYFSSVGDGGGSAGSAVFNNTVTSVTFNDVVYGLYVTGPTSPNYNAKVYDNDISGLVSNGSSSSVYAAYIGATGAGLGFYRNKISDVTANGTSGTAYGLYSSTTTTTDIYNNCIGDIKTPFTTSTNKCNGIYISGGSLMNVFYNTVFLNATSSGANFGSNALFASVIPTLTLRNNILINLCTPTGQGIAAAFKRSSAYLPSYSLLSDNNIFYAGPPSASHLIFHDNTNAIQTLTSLQTMAAPREASSLTENTAFTSTAGSSAAFLHINTGIYSLSNNGAVNISGITDDHDGNVRQGNAGYTGSGTAPDIGADEYAQNLPPCSAAAGGTVTSAFPVICAGQPAHLLSTGFSTGAGTVYQWKTSSSSAGPFSNVTGGVGSSNIAYTSPTLAPGNYFYILTSTCAGTLSGSSGVFSLTVITPPSATAVASASVCEGSAISLTGSGTGNGFYWTGPSGFTSTAQSPTLLNVSAQNEGTYSLVAIGNVCSSPTSTVYVSVNTTTLLLQAVPPSHCSGGTSTLSVIATSALTYTWNSGITTATTAVTTSATAVYSITGTNPSGCNKTSTVSVAIITPTIISNGGVFCGAGGGPGTVSVNSFTPSQVLWYASATATNPVGTGTSLGVNSNVTANYYAQANSTTNGSIQTVMTGGNNSAAGNMFDVFALSNIIVTGIGIHLPVTGTQTVEVWHRAGAFAGFTNSSSGWLQVGTTTVTGNGPGVVTPVPLSFSINILPGQIHAFYITVSPGNLNSSTSTGSAWASNNDLQLHAGNGGGYFSVTTPSTGFNGSVQYIKPGCISPLIPVTYTVQPNPTVTAAANPTLICQGDSTELTASGATGYTWSAGIGNPVHAFPMVTTNFTVTGYDALGCSDSAIVPVQVLPSPTLVTTQTTPSICIQSSVGLSVTGANQYTWSTASTASSIIVTPTVSTIYSVSGIGTTSCISTATLAIIVYSLPVVIVADSVINACENDLVVLSASGALSYNWNPGNFNSNPLNIIVNGTTIYTVTGFNGHCKDKSYVTVVADPCTGLPENVNERFRLFPNPASDILTLRFSAHGNKRIKIFNVACALAGDFETSETQIFIDLLPFAKGLYILTVQSDGHLISQKFVVE